MKTVDNSRMNVDWGELINWELKVGYNQLLGVTFGEENQERAIDVPENFVERKKTPPKFPAEKPVKVTEKKIQEVVVVEIAENGLWIPKLTPSLFEIHQF